MKTKKITPLAVERFHDLAENYREASAHLENQVQLVTVRRDVISLYPDGPDKESAKEDLEKAKYQLLCAIGAVDGVLANMRQYWETHADILQENHCTNPCCYRKSHTIIEDTYFGLFLTR